MDTRTSAIFPLSTENNVFGQCDQNLVSTLIRIHRIQWWSEFFCFRLEIPFLGIFGSKNQNRQFKLNIWYVD